MAILVYVALDLSLPTMPGAFVFEPADSVESIGGGRVVTRVGVLPAPAASPVPAPSPLQRDLPHRRPPSREIVLAGRLPARCLPRITCAPPQPSEDPH